jgi:hypothetical protein
MSRRTLAAAGSIVCAFASVPHAATELPVAAPSIGVDEIEPGQRGYGQSVFVGSTPERFEVEVLGVLRQSAPGTSYILAKLTGHELERTGVIAGMSGSPVWIDGRLAGAVAFSWSFSQQAIAGITPIAAMRGIASSQPWGRAAGTPKTTLDDLLAHRLPADPFAALTALASGGSPVGSPGSRAGWSWSASGFAEPTLARLAAALPAAAPAAGGRVESLAGAIVEGSSVAAVFLDGDFRLAATGTITERRGDTVLAFGHPVAGVGEVSLPLAPAEVVTVMGSSLSSFKIANSGPIAGVFERDHAAGTFGRLGVEPRTLPLRVTVAAPVPRSFAMRLARVPSFMPSLAAVGAYGALDAVTAAGGVEAVDLDITVELASGERVALAQSFDGVGAASQAVSMVFALVDFLARTDLAPVDLAAIDIALTPYAEPRAAELVGAYPTRRRVRPGEALELVLELRGFRGEIERRRLPVTLPTDLPAGRYTLLVGDAASLDAARLAIAPVAPRRLSQALDLIASLGSTRELALLGLSSEPAVAAGGETLARLPPSIRALWAGVEGGARPLRTSIVQSERFPAGGTLFGAVRVDLEIERDAPASGEGGSGGTGRTARRATENRGVDR